jgi:hypothetical protein
MHQGDYDKKNTRKKIPKKNPRNTKQTKVNSKRG